MAGLFLTIIVLVELTAVIIAFYCQMRSRELNPAQSAAYSTFIFLAAASALIQVFFMLGIIRYFMLVDVCAVLFSVSIIRKNWKILVSDLSSFNHFLSCDIKLGLPFILVFLYLLLQVLFLPPLNWDSLVYNVPRVLLMYEQNTLFLSAWSSVRQACFPPGFDVLYHLFLRTGTDQCLAIFSYLCYIIIAFSTYASVKSAGFRKKHINVALVITILICSLPQLVLQATNTKNDLAPAAAGSIMVLASLLFLESRKKIHLALFFLAMIAGISFKTHFLAFCLPFSGLLLITSSRKTGFLSFLKSAINSIKTPLSAVSLFLIISLVSFAGFNHKTFGNLTGDTSYTSQFRNAHGIKGAFANCLRYSLQALSVPRNFGGSILDNIHNSLLGNCNRCGSWEGAKILVSRERFTPNSLNSWYGFLGILFIIPAFLYSVFRSRGIVWNSAFSMLLFFAAVCFAVGWTPWQGRFFTVFASASVLSSAFLASKLSKKSLNALTILSLVILITTALFNESKPFFNLHDFQFLVSGGKTGHPYPGPYVLNWSSMVKNRHMKYSSLFGEDAIDSFANIIDHNASLLIIGSEESCLLPFMLMRRDITKEVANKDQVKLRNDYLNIVNSPYTSSSWDYHYVLALGLRVDQLMNKAKAELLYRADPPVKIPQSQLSLYRILPRY